METKKGAQKSYHCFQCGVPIRFIRSKGGNTLRAEQERCYFVPAPEGEGEEYVTPQGAVRWGYRRMEDGLVGYKKHNCPKARKNVA